MRPDTSPCARTDDRPGRLFAVLHAPRRDEDLPPNASAGLARLAGRGARRRLAATGPVPRLGGPVRLEDAFGGRVAPIQFDPREADPFILLVHHRHAFRPLDFLRPLFSAAIMPEGFPAHPHRGFETVTYVLPGRAGMVHRDSEGCRMRYGDGAVQWMTAGSS